MKLTSDFYLRPDVVQIAKELLGKMLITNIDRRLTAGIIVETEAYAGVIDKASHAWSGRNTTRTQTMYLAGGTAYVYLCYGIHHLFNVVTNREQVPHAVLVRALEPVKGINTMLQRRNKEKLDFTLTSGPGSLSEAMGIKTTHSGIDLQGKQIWIEDTGLTIPETDIIASPRVGVGYAEDHALWNYRFRVRGNKWTSKAR